MIVIVDRYNGKAVQKVTKPNGALVRYQVVSEDTIGNTGEIGVFVTLESARKHIGRGVVAAHEAGHEVIS